MEQCSETSTYTSYLPAYEDGVVLRNVDIYFAPTCLWRWSSVPKRRHVLQTYLPMKMEQCSETSTYTSYLPAYEDGSVPKRRRILHTYLPMMMEQCSETSTYKIQTPRNYPEKKNIQHSEHGESLKSRINDRSEMLLVITVPCTAWSWQIREFQPERQQKLEISKEDVGFIEEAKRVPKCDNIRVLP